MMRCMCSKSTRPYYANPDVELCIVVRELRLLRNSTKAKNWIGQGMKALRQILKKWQLVAVTSVSVSMTSATSCKIFCLS